MAFKTITLRLARNPGIPAGDDRKGYIIRAPLTPDGDPLTYRMTGVSGA